MAKEIVEVTKETKDRRGLITHLYFHEGFEIPEKEIMGIYEAEITTLRKKKSNPEVYETTGKVLGIGKLEEIDSVKRFEWEESVLAHFEAVNNLKKAYLDD